jgi:secretion/DNA translocation related TadE-like protein
VTRDAGSASVLVLGAAAVLMLVAGTFGVAASVASAHRRAGVAADLTALAAALDEPRCLRATDVARVNGAQLIGCSPGTDNDVTVTVAVDVPLPALFGGSRRVTTSARAGRVEDPVSARAGAA